MQKKFLRVWFCLTDQDRGLADELVGRDFQVERGGALADTPGGVVVRTVQSEGEEHRSLERGESYGERVGIKKNHGIASRGGGD